MSKCPTQLACIILAMVVETASFIPGYRKGCMYTMHRDNRQCPLTLMSRLTCSVPLISSVTNPLVKRLVRIRENSRFRKEEDSVLLVGSSPIQEVLGSAGSESGQCRLKTLILLDEDGEEWHNEYMGRFPSDGAEIYKVSSTVMKKVSGLESSERHIAVAELEMPKPVSNRGEGGG